MVRQILMLVLIGWSLTGTAWGQAAMITQVTGGVTATGKGGAQPAVPFLKLDEGDTLHTENSYKFTIEGLRALAAQAGFRPGPVWTDADRLFSVHWLNAPGP